MSDSTQPLPDRVCSDYRSPYYLQQSSQIGIKFNGQEIRNVAEYCVSEGWIRRFIIQNGRAKIERGRAVTCIFYGKVEPYWRSQEVD